MQSVLVLSYFPSIFFWKCDNFLDYGMILTLCLLMVSFFSFLPFLIIFIACSFKDSQNHLMQSLPLYTSYLFSTSEYSYRRHWITTWNMFPYFCFGWFFRIIYISKEFSNLTLNTWIKRCQCFKRFITLSKISNFKFKI